MNAMHEKSALEGQARIPSWQIFSFLGGLLGAVAFNFLAWMSVKLGVLPVALYKLFGVWLTGTTGLGASVLGFAAHVLGGGVIGVFYGSVFRATSYTGWRFGAMVALGHWTIAGWLLGLMDSLPGKVPVPGFFSANYGTGGFVATLVLYLVFGAIVGEVFAVAARSGLVEGLSFESVVAKSPMADSEGQGLSELEEYKRRRIS